MISRNLNKDLVMIVISKLIMIFKNYLNFFLLVMPFVTLSYFLLNPRIPMSDMLWTRLMFQRDFLNNYEVLYPISTWNHFSNLGAFTTDSFSYFSFGNLILPFLAWQKFFTLNAIDLFYFSIFMEETIFISGLILLSRELNFRKLTTAFIVVVLYATTNPYTGYFSHLLIFLYPMAYFFYVRATALRIDQIIYFGTVLFFNIFFSPAYLVLFHAFVFFISTFLFYKKEIFKKRIEIKPQLKRISLAASIPATTILFYIIFTIYPLLENINTSPNRDSNMRVAINTFLKTGGYNRFSKYIELLTGLPLNLYTSHYLGPFFIVLFSLAIMNYKYLKQRHFFNVTLITGFILIILTSPKTPGFEGVARAVYYLIPFMSYIRHLGLLSGVVNFFMVLISAYGIEYLLSNYNEIRNKKIIKISIILTLISIFLNYFIVQDNGALLSRFYISNILFTNINYPPQMEPFIEMSAYNILSMSILVVLLLLCYLNKSIYRHLPVLIFTLTMPILIGFKQHLIANYTTRVTSAAAYANFNQTNKFLPHTRTFDFRTKDLFLKSSNNEMIFYPFQSDFIEKFSILKPYQAMPHLDEFSSTVSVTKQYATSFMLFDYLGVDSCTPLLRADWASKYMPLRLVFKNKQDFLNIMEDLACGISKFQIRNQNNEIITNDLKITKFKNDYIELIINKPLLKDQFLFVSIPYNKYWKVNNNKNKIPIEIGRNGFMKLNQVNAGKLIIDRRSIGTGLYFYYIHIILGIFVWFIVKELWPNNFVQKISLKT